MRPSCTLWKGLWSVGLRATSQGGRAPRGGEGRAARSYLGPKTCVWPGPAQWGALPGFPAPTGHGIWGTAEAAVWQEGTPQDPPGLLCVSRHVPAPLWETLPFSTKHKQKLLRAQASGQRPIPFQTPPFLAGQLQFSGARR